MASNRNSSSDGMRRGPRGGFFWLFLAAAVGGLFAIFVYAPGVISGIIGGQPMPRDLGDEPVVTAAVDADVAAKDYVANARAQRDAPVVTEAKVPEKKIEVDKTPEVKVVEDTGPKDLKRGAEILARAEEAYRGYQWEEARSLSKGVLELDIDQATKLRAQDIFSGSGKLEDLFTRLGEDREELTRAPDVHPSLLEVVIGGKKNLIVPVVDLRSREVVESDDPVGYFKGVLAAGGEAPVMTMGGIGTTYKSGEVTEVLQPDLTTVMNTRRSEFSEMLSRFKNDPDLRRDPMAWYSAARFAYRNRIDDKVTEMLDRALLMEPDLGKAIREDKAQEHYANMVYWLDRQNQQRAAGFMAQLRKRYEDTDVFIQAEAYYKNDIRKATELMMAQVREKEKKEKAALVAQMERAKARQDEEELRRLEEDRERAERKAKEAAEYKAQAPTEAGGPVSGDEAEANRLFDEGFAIYEVAKNMPATKERDALYRKAKPYFVQATNMYIKIYNAGNTSVEKRMHLASKLKFACFKATRM